MYFNKISSAEFLESVTVDFDEKLAQELNARCEAFVESDEARGIVLYSVEDYENYEAARSCMNSAADILVENFGFTLK